MNKRLNLNLVNVLLSILKELQLINSLSTGLNEEEKSALRDLFMEDNVDSNSKEIMKLINFL